jgi:hypothetical protein
MRAQTKALVLPRSKRASNLEKIVAERPVCTENLVRVDDVTRDDRACVCRKLKHGGIGDEVRPGWRVN